MSAHKELPEELIFSEQARTKLQLGISKLNKAVSTTMGPKGRTVLIQRKYSAVSTKDGVTVAQNVKLQDPIEKIGANLVKEVAQKTAEEAGDGTTTATVLAHALFSEGIKLVQAGANPLELKEGIEKAKSHVIDELQKHKRDVKDIKELKDIATISANGDDDIGNMISKALTEVTKDGVVTVEEAKGISDELKITHGLQYQRGYESPYFINSTAKMQVELSNCYILLYNDRIHNIKSILPVLEKATNNKKPILIICNTIDEEALNTLVVNKMRGNLDVCIVKSPGFGNTLEYLEDIRCVTGGVIQNPSMGVVFSDIDTDIGFADTVIVTKNDFTIICKSADDIQVEKRVQELKSTLETDLLEHIKIEIKERIAKLVGGVAVIKVQAPTELETKEKRDRVDDALGATRAAQEEGIIIGAGTALYKIDLTNNLSDLSGDVQLGYKILLKAIKAPFTQILKNANKQAEVIAYKFTDFDSGYNVRTHEYGNLYDMGVIDSFKVQRVALTNAVSVVGTLLSTECIIPYIDPNIL